MGGRTKAYIDKPGQGPKQGSNFMFPMFNNLLTMKVLLINLFIHSFVCLFVYLFILLRLTMPSGKKMVT